MAVNSPHDRYFVNCPGCMDLRWVNARGYMEAVDDYGFHNLILAECESCYTHVWLHQDAIHVRHEDDELIQSNMARVVWDISQIETPKESGLPILGDTVPGSIRR